MVKILISLLLFSLSLSQNIITSWNYDKVAMYGIQKINTFLLSQFHNKVFDIDTSISKDNIEITNIKLTDIQTSLYDSLLNYNNGLFLFTPNKMTLFFNFTYKDSSLGLSDTAVLELKIDTLKIKVKNDKDNRKYSITTKMTSPIDNYYIPDVKDKDLATKLKEAFCSGFNEQSVLTKTISDVISEGFLKYISDFYSKKKELYVETNEFFGKFRFSMKNNKFLYFCEDLLAEYKNNFCYYLGYSSKDEVIRDKSNIPLANERFAHNEDDLFNVFINKDMMEDIINYITSSYLTFNAKIYNDKTNIKQLSYEFNVASLKKYFKGLDNYEDSDTFYCEVNILKIALKEAYYTVRFIIKDSNFVIGVNSNITIDIPLTKNVRLNFCLKEAKANKVEMVTIGTTVEITDSEGLIKAIDESFDLKTNKICLSDNGISLRDYFSKIKNISIREEGLYLEGDHLYQ